MTEQEQLVWMAGFFDGEGCVAINRIVHKRKSGNYLGYTMTVSICQKVEEPLKLFHAAFGGNLYPYQVNGITYYRWHTWSAGAARFIDAVIGFSILKRQRLLMASSFQKDMTVWNREYGRRGYPNAILKAREDYYLRMKELNRRGVSASNPTPSAPGVKRGAPNYFRKSTDIEYKGDDLRVN